VIIKHVSDIIPEHSPTCGQGLEILTGKDYAPFSVAVFMDIKPTIPHYHETFEETYFVLDGSITLGLYDPSTDQYSSVVLNANELCVIPKLTHHGISEASNSNRLCVLAAPPFHMDDEHLSDKLHFAAAM
jgi:mannose-6-phosphate isomerase-like protein (cupin superfamily)